VYFEGRNVHTYACGGEEQKGSIRLINSTSFTSWGDKNNKKYAQDKGMLQIIEKEGGAQILAFALFVWL